MGAVPYNNLWSVAVLGHSAYGPWSLQGAEGVWLATGHALRSKRGGGHTFHADDSENSE